jgi:isocitrate lyase
LQVAADANSSGNMYPDQSLYPVDSVPAVVRRINKALQRADQIQTMAKADGFATTDIDFFVPIIADAEAGFGGSLNVFELMKAMIEAGARRSISRTSWRARRSAGIWAGRSWCRPASSSAP